MNLAHGRGGALLATAALVIACAADAGEDPKPAFGSQEAGSVGADGSGGPPDSAEARDSEGDSNCPATAPTVCGGTCVDTSGSASHCGTCANACSTTLTHAQPACVSAACTFTCDPGYATCNDGCVDELSDNNNCGGCGSAHACSSGALCSAGHCTSSDAGVDASADTGVDGTADTGVDAKADAVEDAPGREAAGADATPTESGAGACSTCSGCCDPVNANCRAGTSDALCGTGGATCVNCASLSMTCTNTTCQ